MVQHGRTLAKKKCKMGISILFNFGAKYGCSQNYVPLAQFASVVKVMGVDETHYSRTFLVGFIVIIIFWSIGHEYSVLYVESQGLTIVTTLALWNVKNLLLSHINCFARSVWQTFFWCCEISHDQNWKAEQLKEVQCLSRRILCRVTWLGQVSNKNFLSLLHYHQWLQFCL